MFVGSFFKIWLYPNLFRFKMVPGAFKVCIVFATRLLHIAFLFINLFVYLFIYSDSKVFLR